MKDNEMRLARILARALESVSVRMADGGRVGALDYCEQCQASSVHGSPQRCDCWCHQARASLESLVETKAAPEQRPPRERVAGAAARSKAAGRPVSGPPAAPGKPRA